MRLTQKSLRKLDTGLRGISHGTVVVPGLADPTSHKERLKQLGLDALEVGDAMVPPPVGKFTEFNAEGREVVHKDQPKVRVYRDAYVRWIEWHGPDMREEWGVQSRPYKQYPRTQEPPVGLELRLVETSAGDRALVTAAFTYGHHDEDLLHAINLMLELFGECDLLTEDFSAQLGAPTRRLNWELLRPGEMTTAGIRRRLEPAFKGKPVNAQHVAEHRLAVAESLKPEFLGVGRGGFRGYIVFGFPSKNLYVLECLFHGNATYIFGEDWEDLSQLTKTQVLHERRYKHRLEHRGKWGWQLRRIVQSAVAA